MCSSLIFSCPIKFAALYPEMASQTRRRASGRAPIAPGRASHVPSEKRPGRAFQASRGYGARRDVQLFEYRLFDDIDTTFPAVRGEIRRRREPTMRRHYR